MSVHNTKEKILRSIVWLFLFIETVAFILLGIRLFHMGILPSAYMAAYVIVALILSLLLFFWSLKVKRIKNGIIVIFLSLLLAVVAFWVYGVLGDVQDAVDNVTSAGEEVITEMTILVLKDSDVSDITQMGEYLIGYVDDGSEEIGHIKEELNTILGEEVKYAEFKDVFSLVDALYSKVVNAIIIDKAFVDVIADTEGYETFLEDVREVYTTEIVNHVNLIEEEADKEKKLNQFVVYVSGIDRFGAVSARSRSDVNLLIAINTETKQIQMINTPRDYFVPLANSSGIKDKLTHAGLYGVNNSISTLEMLYDVEIDYYVRMNFSGFEAIIDALGGIDVYSEYEFVVEPIKHYEVGMNRLNGLEALAFARERHSFAAGDVQRGKNQMEVVKATIRKAFSSEILSSYSEVLESVSGTFQTNMTSEEVYALVKMQLSDRASWQMSSYSVTGSGSKSTTYSMPNTYTYVMIPDNSKVAEAQRLIANVLEGTDK